MSMKLETIISRLEILKNWLKRNGFPGAKPAENALREAIKLIKRNEPIEPITHPETKYHYEIKECAVCGRMLNRGARFCHMCGQAVKLKHE